MLIRLSLLRVVQAKMYDQLQLLCLLSITSRGMSKKITFHAPLFDQSWLVDPSPEQNSTAECLETFRACALHHSLVSWRALAKNVVKELVVCWSAQKSTGRHWFSSMPRVVDVGWSHCLLSFLCHYDCLYLQFTWIEWILLIHQFIFLVSVLSLPSVNLQLFHRYLMWLGVFFRSHWSILSHRRMGHIE